MTESQKGSYAAPERFTVSHLGMRELHADRPPWHLVKELVQNSWDEAPDATVCAVTIKPVPGQDATRVTVEDDGPGFKDVADAWTLMKHTDKRASPTKRGRYNLGEKEIISVAIEAQVETVGHTIDFPPLGSRVVSTNKRSSGTVISVTMPWTQEQAELLAQKLMQFRPTECRLVVNGQETPHREPLRVRSAIMNTVLQEGPGEPMRPTRRRTDIHILERANENESWLYEMGIPIQPITTPWDVDIQQKVPMPPNRDTVSESYLTDLYAEVLNENHPIMEANQFGESWVKQAMEDPRTESGAVKSTFQGRYGKKALLISSDADANMKAAESGYELINSRSLSGTERERFREDAGAQTAYQVFGNPKPEVTAFPPRDERQKEFASWVRQMASHCDLNAKVLFFDDPHARKLADCTASTITPTVRFNVALLGEGFFNPPYNREDQMALVFHELGHAMADKPMEHGPSWGEAVAELAGKISSRVIAGAEKTTPQGE